jgi:hypothetical protein
MQTKGRINGLTAKNEELTKHNELLSAEIKIHREENEAFKNTVLAMLGKEKLTRETNENLLRADL